MLLAMAGVYGVMSYLAGQRAPELGLRMALGAKPAQLATLMLRQTVALGAIGLVLGLAGAAATTRVLKGMLFEVQPNDPSIYAGVAFVLGIVVVAASFFPARRAAKADPLVALRQE